MPMRNPFRKAASDFEVSHSLSRDGADRSFEKTTLTTTKAIDIKEPIEYKLCEINDSGVYLPPSPIEKKGFWPTTSRSSTTSNHRSLLNDNEPFNISRESFDSYRRSFDISARSPMPGSDGWTRPSLDSRRAALSARPSLDRRSQDRLSIDRPRGVVSPTANEGFVDVGLDEPKPQRKRGLFARFGDNSNSSETNGEARPTSRSGTSSGGHGFHFSGRKRGQSGQGAELNNMPRSPVPTVAVEGA